MIQHIKINRATSKDSTVVAEMAGELLNEIMSGVGVKAFNFNLGETIARAVSFIDEEKYFVFMARNTEVGNEVGFITLYESYALYAEGVFGTIPELYVRPEYRSHDVGKRLIDSAKAFGAARGWKRLEVTTPPLPQFERTLRFYEKESFSVSGGRKLKVLL